MIDFADKDGDGVVNEKEFIKFLKKTTFDWFFLNIFVLSDEREERREKASYIS